MASGPESCELPPLSTKLRGARKLTLLVPHSCRPGVRTAAASEPQKHPCAGHSLRTPYLRWLGAVNTAEFRLGTPSN